jgi:hypothetical protein
MPARRILVTTRCPDAATLQRILSFNDGFFRRVAGVSDAAAFDRFHSCPDAFHCVVEEGVPSSTDGVRIYGFFVLLPLSPRGVDRLRGRVIASSRQLREQDLATFDTIAGLYLSVVCADGRFARAAAITGCIDTVARLYRTTGVRTLFVRAATKEGAQMLTRLTNEVFEADRTVHEVNLAPFDAVLRSYPRR